MHVVLVLAAGDFFGLSKVWAAQRVALPRCACRRACAGDAPRSGLPLAGHHLDGRGRGCGAAAGCTPLLRPDWPTPRGEAARVASGPRLPFRLPSLCLFSLSPSRLSSQQHRTTHAPHPLLPAELDGTMQISFGGWMREVTGLDLMGGGPVQCDCTSHPTGPQLRRLSLDGWLFISLQSSPVPPSREPGFCPCRAR